ncbi:MAG: ATP-binding protein [Pedobacter sp.]
MNDDDKTKEQLLDELSELRQRIAGQDLAVSESAEYERALKELRKEAERGSHLLQLYEKASQLTDKELYDFALDEVVYLTDSEIGFFHLVSDDQKDIILTTWNRGALMNCTAAYATHYAIDLAGNWVDSIRFKRPVVYNDFPISPNRKGLPEGHAPIRRFMSIPVFEGDKVRFIFGVGNKVEEYGEKDLIHLQLVANELHKIILQRGSEEALRESEERFRSLVEQSPISIVIIRDMKVLYANSKYAEMHGYANADEMLRLRIKTLIAQSSWEQFVAQATKHENRLLFEMIYETVGVRKDGSEFDALVTTTRVNLADGPASMGFVQDITAHKQTEKEISRLNDELNQKIDQLVEAQEDLVRKEKLSILGRLSGSVGHELRNPLGIMNNAVYFLKMVLAGADETVKEYLDIIKKEIDNSLRIITDLLDFARTKAPQIKAVTARELMDASLAICAIPENINLQTEIQDNLPLLRVDQLQMEQVLTNLITNAVQAMPDGGALRIAARLMDNPGGTLRGSPVSGDHTGLPLQETANFIEISVTDTGEGISPENMKKLFQPLFTTKAKGIGLGLVVCKNLVEANGGRIEVASRLGEGTTFSMLLKLVQ